MTGILPDLFGIVSNVTVSNSCIGKYLGFCVKLGSGVESEEYA